MRGTAEPMMAEGSVSVGFGGGADLPLAWAASMKAMNSLKCMVSPRSLGGLGGQGEGADDAALGEVDFEGVFGLRVRVAEGFLRGMTEGGEIDGVAFESPFGFERAPGFGADSAERYAGEGDAVAFGAERRRQQRRARTRRRRGRGA